jgi:hypothetical protein
MDLLFVRGEVRKVEERKLDGRPGEAPSRMVSILVLFEDSIISLWSFADTLIELGMLFPEVGDSVTYFVAAKPTKSGNSVSYQFKGDHTAEFAAVGGGGKAPAASKFPAK